MSDLDLARRHEAPTERDVSVEWTAGEACAALPDLSEWIVDLVSELAPDSTSLAVRLVSEGEMRRLNRTFRRIDKPTDVLSFPGTGDAEAGSAGGYRHLGDIAIAVPVAECQAAERGHSLETEIKTLVLHGVLHCLGHDHETDGGEMEALESGLRSRWIPVEPASR